MKVALERPVRVYLCDIDGCLVAVGHETFDLEAVKGIQELSVASHADDTIPKLTIQSGRPHPYVDAIMQLLDVRLPAIFENGVGLAYRDPYRGVLADGLEKRTRDLRVLEDLVRSRDDLTLQLGKEASASVFPYPSDGDIERVNDALQKMMREHDLDLILDPSNDCMNVLLPDVDKRSGVLWLARELELEPAELAGIGDSAGDVEWLRLCGASCAPANASDDVKNAVTHQSHQHDATAALEFYRALVEANRQLRD